MKSIITCLFILLIPFLTGCHKRESSHNSLFFNLYCEPPSLDPGKATDLTSANVLIGLFEGLTRIENDHLPHLALAEKIDISLDKRTYTFTLRQAYWNDGMPITSEDFVYAWKRVLDPTFPSPFAYKLYVIEHGEAVKNGKKLSTSLGIKALDAKTLQVRLCYPTPYFLELIAFPTFFPVPKHQVEKNDRWADEAPIVCNGPFSLKTWIHESELVFEKNTKYWDKKNVFLKNIHFSMIDDTTTEYYMFEQGELDWAGSPLSNLPVDSIAPLQEEGKLYSYPAAALYFYKVNTTSFPCNNVHIRKALAYAIDRDKIVSHVLQGGQLPATALVPTIHSWEKNSHFKDGDSTQAKASFEKGLQELGLKKETFPRLVLSYNANREHQRVALAIQQQWNEVLGIEVDLETSDWKSYLSKVNRLEYQIARSGWVGDFSDPVAFLQLYAKKEEPSNETGWEHPLYHSLLKSAAYEPNPSYRFFLLKQAEAILIDEMPVIPLYYIIYSYVKKSYVKDIYLSSLGIIDFKRAWIDVNE